MLLYADDNNNKWTLLEKVSTAGFFFSSMVNFGSSLHERIGPLF